MILKKYIAKLWKNAYALIKNGCSFMQILKKEIQSRIQQVATHEFLRNGYQEVTMRDIAKKSAISVGNLYNYYKNKEDLFDSLTSASYLYLNQLLREVNEHGPESGVANTEFAKSLVLKIAQLLKKHRVGFLLMIDRGQGTKYHNLKKEMMTLLVRHFEAELTDRDKPDASLIMRIAAKNLMYGLIEIAKNYRGDEWADRNIESLIDYHLHGISQLYI
jgi:AcrR family transcriptional regulator